MSRHFLIAVIFLSLSAHAQNLKSSWKHFKASGWRVTLQQEPIPYVGETAEGVVTFSNNGYRVRYFVFKVADFDSAFQARLQKWYYLQACSHVGGKYSFPSFILDGYRYELEPCYICNTLMGDHLCENLAKSISDFVRRKDSAQHGLLR
jgi:hypothetical protein